MLKRLYRITKNTDFDRVFREGIFYNHPLFYVRTANNGLEYSRFGFIVSAKLFKKANKRNRARRLMREAVRVNLDGIKRGFDIVFGIKSKDFYLMDYRGVEDSLMSYLKKDNLLL